ncbi:MAG: cysteine desulfurase, partial [Candidatus Eremiobacteraeota bacterium]|nr:cysteine desulfurase [Candidatus Eremiobacteraeota bacterium]
MNSDGPRIFLDYAATTPLRPESFDAMREALSAGFNPSSLHAEGRRARALLDAARERVAAALGVRPKEIEFTGSGTESDNHALLGVAHALGRRGRIVSTVFEHHAILHALDRLRDEGFEIALVGVESDGTVDPDRFEAALTGDTILATVMYANNELGTLAPIEELARRAHARGALFHTDAIQVPGWLALRPRELGVDLLSLSAHKFFGPKGVGALYVRDGVALAPILHGGGQEHGRRSGTENVLGIAGLARALELAVAEQAERAPRVAALRDRLEAGILESIPDTRVNGAGAPRLPHFSSVS